jgi:tRNA/rRNA methyltransferase
MHFTFILVEPKVAENIGASARALKTMGFDTLYLVNPCEYLSGKSKWVAHGSYDILESAITYNTLNEAIEGMDLVIGTTARFRIIKKDYIEIGNLNSLLQAKTGTANKVAIVFGREESGLTNEEMLLCDITTSVPLQQEFPSLNLSQAVMIYAYQLSSLSARLDSTTHSEPGQLSLKALRAKMTIMLELAGIRPGDVIFGRIMERIALAGDTDIRLMHSVTSSILKKLQ